MAYRPERKSRNKIKCLGILKSYQKVRTGLVACRTGSVFNAAYNNLSVGIGLSAVVAMDEKVFHIMKGSLMVPVRETMCADLFEDGGRILIKIAGNVFNGETYVQRILDVDTVFKCQVFLITRNIFAHMYVHHLLLSDGETNIS